MKRGEVWWVSFEPVSSSGPKTKAQPELTKERPAVIMSNDSANRFLNRVQIVPLSSQIDKIYPSEALVSLNGRSCKAMADQLTTASKKRLSNRAGVLSETDLAAVEGAIRLQLSLE